MPAYDECSIYEAKCREGKCSHKNSRTPNKVIVAYNAIKFCPECGKELEIHPISGWKACFLHGDFTTTSETIVWNFTSNLIKREGE